MKLYAYLKVASFLLLISSSSLFCSHAQYLLCTETSPHEEKANDLLHCHPIAPVLVLSDGGPVDPISQLRDVREWTKSLLKLVQEVDSDAKFVRTVRYARECLSYNILGNNCLHELRRQCLRVASLMVAALKNKESICLFQWPHQKVFQAFMGHLFFPVQLEDLAEAPTALQQREHLQNMLAISACYKNTLAQRHMVDILSLFETEQDEGKKGKKKRERINQFETYFGAEGQAQLDAYCVNLKEAKGVPLYFCGLLNIMEGNIPLSQGCFNAGAGEKDARCMVRQVMNLKLGAVRDKVVQELEGMHPGLAAFVKASAPGDRDARLLLYCQAGEQGVAEGYKAAGILAQSGGKDRRPQARRFFLLAARHHILDCWDKVAELALEEGNAELATQALKAKGECGDADGFAGEEYRKARFDTLVRSMRDEDK